MMVFITHVLLVLLFPLITASNRALSIPDEQQISSLRDLYYNTSGPFWLWKYPLSKYGNIWNFTGDSVNPCDNWQGVSCDAVGNVISISLDSYGLNGSIPSTISNLLDLEQLYIHNNHLTSTIPHQFCDMPNLYYLYLGVGSLTGTVPACLTQTGYLKYLSLHINYLTGFLPSFTESAATNMTYLSFSANFISGSIPDSYRYLTNLTSFYVSYNQLTGSIDAIPNMHLLQRLSIANNMFDCTIPSSIGKLTKLQYIYLQQNNLHGSVPEVEFSQLIYFSIYDNLLSRLLPELMLNWDRLEVVAIDGNLFSGSLAVGTWKYLQQLTVYDNLFDSSLPHGISKFSYLTMLLVQKNLFTGNPGSAFNRSIQLNLETIDLSSNFFTGSIPVECWGKRLTSFSAFQSCYSGSIPTSICDATALETLSLDGLTSYCSKSVWPGIPGSPKYARRVEGTIPNCLWTDLPNITTLQISGNGLHGTIPSLETYGNLTSLDLSFNSLIGSIPFVLQSWHLLSNLNLESNKLTGTISGLELLPYSNALNAVSTALTLSDNRLSGEIPRAIEYTRHIDIVEGNLFSCSNKHQPPQYDSDSTNFVCASNLLDMSLFLFLAVGSLIVALILVAWFIVVRYYLHSSNVFSMMFELVCFVNDYHKLEESLQFIKDKKQRAVLKNEHVLWMDNAKIFLLSVLWWKSRVALLINSDLKEKGHDVVHLVQFLKSLRSLRRLIIVLMFVMVTISIPLYTALKNYYATYTIQYRWKISGVFLSGNTPAISIFCLWAMVLLITLLWIKHTIPPMVDKPFYLSALQSWRSSENSTSRNADETSSTSGSENESKSSLVAKNFRSTLGQSIKRSSVVKNINAAITYVSRISMWISIAALTLNILVVLTMKAGFIYLLVSSNTSFGIKVLIEVCLAGLDVIWTAVLVPSLITNLPKKRSTSRMMLKSAMLYFNSVIAPCLVIAVADASCFEGLFVRQNPETESFTFHYCNLYNDQDSMSCLETSSWQSSTQYTPLFYYNYNCYSTIVVEYIPVFLLSYSVLSLLIPLVSAFLITRKVRWRILDLFPGVYFLNVDIDDKVSVLSTESAENCNMHSSLHEDKDKVFKVESIDSVDPSKMFTRIPFGGNSGPSNTNFANDASTISNVEVVNKCISSSDNLITNEERGRKCMESFENKLLSVNSESTTKQQIIFPQYILASAIHHLLVMLTFALMSPSLAVAVALVVSSATLTWEVLIGRWMVQDNVLRKTYDPSNMSHQFSLACQDPDVLPFIGPFTKKLDELCIDVCCAPTKCYGLIAFGSAIFFACVTVDIAGDKYGWENAIWLAGIVFGYALICYCYFNYRQIESFSRRQFSRFQSRSRSMQYSYDHRRDQNSNTTPTVAEPTPNGSVSERVEASIIANQNKKNIISSFRGNPLRSADLTQDMADSFVAEPSRTTSRIELTDSGHITGPFPVRF